MGIAEMLVDDPEALFFHLPVDSHSDPCVLWVQDVGPVSRAVHPCLYQEEIPLL